MGEHTCFAGPIIEDQCAVCGCQLGTDHTPLTDEELAAIKARVEAAPAGPWEAVESNRDSPNRSWPDWELRVPGSTWNDGRFWVGSMDEGRTLAEFIAHTRTDVPALVAEVERLRAALAPFVKAVMVEDVTHG